METYSLPKLGTAAERCGIDATIEAAIAAAAKSLEGLIDGPRHAEAFAFVA
jgi:hypothetical protein